MAANRFGDQWAVADAVNSICGNDIAWQTGHGRGLRLWRSMDREKISIRHFRLTAVSFTSIRTVPAVWEAQISMCPIGQMPLNFQILATLVHRLIAQGMNGLPGR